MLAKLVDPLRLQKFSQVMLLSGRKVWPAITRLVDITKWGRERNGLLNRCVAYSFIRTAFGLLTLVQKYNRKYGSLVSFMRRKWQVAK